MKISILFVLAISFVLAVLPIVLLCGYIYFKDTNKEPFKLLAKIFLLGVSMALPVMVIELFLDLFVSAENISNFFLLFFVIFVTVALVEEIGKWIIAKFIGYDDKEFDEIYDMIVYSVFSSLGFACIENILYVVFNDIEVAFFRAILSVPGHMCFGVIMGYFLSKAKINYVNGKNGSYVRNMIFSIFVPSLVHTLYDTLVYHYSSTGNIIELIVFIIVDINMVAICFLIVNMVSRVQTRITDNMNNGKIVNTNGMIEYINNDVEVVNYCPVCGKYVNNSHYCGRCGLKLK